MRASTLARFMECLAIAALGLPAAAQTTGAIEGNVLDAVAQTPVPDAVVIARSSALQGEQTAVTDRSGRFHISLLPVGRYELVVQCDGYQPFAQEAVLLVRLGQTLKVKLSVVPEAMSAGEVVIAAARPIIDMRSAQSGAVIAQEQMRLVPYGRNLRTFEAVATSVPGVFRDRYGVSMRGSGSPEGNYIVDGVNVTNPAFGTQGTALLQDFVQEIEVRPGGYQAEYGRSSGGVINVVTKSGGNETHGSVFFNWSPIELPRKRVLIGNTPLAVDESQRYSLDFGAEVGGAILRDRLWFFLGFAPQFNSVNEDRLVQALQDDGSGRPIVQSDGTPDFREIARKRYTQTSKAFQFSGKLTWLMNENHGLALALYGDPAKTSGAFGDMRGNEGTFLYEHDSGSADLSLRYAGKLFDKQMLVETAIGYSRQFGIPLLVASRPIAIGSLAADTLRDTPRVLWNRPRNLLDPVFQDATTPDYQRNLAACEVHPNAFDPCPVTGYATGGVGGIRDEKLERISAGATLTNFFELAGHHQSKYGLDVALDSYAVLSSRSGNALAVERIGPGDFAVTQFGYQDASRAGLPAVDEARPGHVLGEQFVTVTRNRSLSFFLQDTWSIFDRIVLDAGIRGEKQLMYGDPHALDAQGNTIQRAQLQLFNLMPRVGLLYDFTGRGLSKVYGSVGRFYEFVPLDAANRSLSGFPTFTFFANPDNCAPPSATILPHDPRYCSVLPQRGGRTYQFSGNTVSTAVDPRLEGQYVDEAQAGAQLQVYRDVVFAVDYVHRQLGRIIEDMSVDDGATYFISNPGEPGKLGYKAVTGTGATVIEPPPRRVYDGITFSIRKSFSRNSFFTTSYTYSALRGNHSGLFRNETGQLDPNILSDYDLVSLLPNRDGPLPGDIPNSFKADGGYVFELSPLDSIQLGGNLRVDQGQPINYLGAHPRYGTAEAYVLPRGSAGRLPWVWQIDGRAALTHKLGSRYAATLSLDVFNLTNNRAVTAVNERYTDDSVYPIVNGRLVDLPFLKTINGQPATVNAAFRNPTSYQLPLSLRAGARLSF